MFGSLRELGLSKLSIGRLSPKPQQQNHKNVDDLPHTNALINWSQDAVKEVEEATTSNAQLANKIDLLVDRVSQVCAIHASNISSATEQIQSTQSNVSILKDITTTAHDIAQQLTKLEKALDLFAENEQLATIEDYKKNQEHQLDEYMRNERRKLAEKHTFYNNQVEQYRIDNRKAKIQSLDNDFAQQMEQYKQRFEGVQKISHNQKQKVTEAPLDIDLDTDNGELDAFLDDE